MKKLIIISILILAVSSFANEWKPGEWLLTAPIYLPSPTKEERSKINPAKKLQPSEVIIAIKAVCKGKKHISKKLYLQLSGNYSLNCLTGNNNQPNQLTPKESEVLSFISTSYLPKCIAQFLNIEYCTVMTHKKRMLRKFNLNNDAELTKYAIRNGLTSLN